jgi:hypothetical protein
MRDRRIQVLGQEPRRRRIRMTTALTSSARKMAIPTISSRVATFSVLGGNGPASAAPTSGNKAGRSWASKSIVITSSHLAEA